MATSTQSPPSSVLYSTPTEWRSQLSSLPTLTQTNGRIPAVFLAHGQPNLIASTPSLRLPAALGSDGPQANFLRDLGPALLAKYAPKAIVVFSAHWESEKRGEVVVTDYGREGGDNPLLMDYYGFPKESYETVFESKGEPELSRKVVQLLEAVNIPARLTIESEPRGRDGRGFSGPGLDHGVFVPFLLMFGTPCPLPIIQVSLPSLSPLLLWKTGQAFSSLRSQGILIVAGGLTIHSFENQLREFDETKAGEGVKEFERELVRVVQTTNSEERKEKLVKLVEHPNFREAHPREEHFVPLYIAAGAGEGGNVRVLAGMHGAKTFAFGV